MSINKIFKSYIFYVALMIIFLVDLKSAEISIKVIDITNHKPISDVRIIIRELNKEQLTDTDGVSIFQGIEPGKYNLNFFHIAYKNNSRVILVDNINSTINILVHLTPMVYETNTIIVTGKHSDIKLEEFREMKNILEGKDLERDLNNTLAASLKNEVGIAVRSMGPAPARPVVRGISGDRIVIAENGVKSNDLSATSPDHSVAVEPYTVDRIEVLRGAKILTYTSSTMGGLVNVLRDENIETIGKKVTGNIGFYAESVNSGYLGAGKIIIPFYDFGIMGELSYRKANNLSTPMGELKNSQLMTKNYFAGLFYNNNSFHSQFGIREFLSDYGIPGNFVGGHKDGVNINMFKREITLRSRFYFNGLKSNNLELLLSKTYYNHKEFENRNVIGAEFAIFDYSADLRINLQDYLYSKETILGTSLEFKDFNIGGYVFTAPTKSMNFNGYFFQSYKFEDFLFDYSLRFDYINFSPRKATVTARDEFIKKRDFLNWSGIFTFQYEFLKNHFIGLSLGKTSRSPSIEELYSEGPHLAAYSYERGNPNLNNEQGFTSEIFFLRKTENFSFIMNYYSYYLDSYIIHQNTGKIHSATLLPIYQASNVDSRIQGIESSIELRIFEDIKLSSSVSYTIGKNLGNNTNLPLIPPLKNLTQINFDFNKYSFGFIMEYAMKQDKVSEFEEETDGYFVINFFSQVSFLINNYLNSLTLNVDNITNELYRNHLSRIKMIVPEAGRNFRINYRVYF